MKPIAILDACVLYPAELRNFLVRLHTDGDVYLPRWSEDIQREWVTNLLKNRPTLKKAALQRTCSLLNDIQDTFVAAIQYQGKIAHYTLPDVDDRHVLAAAVACSAEHIITFNLKDFPATILSKYKICAIHPDHCVQMLIKAKKVEIVTTFECLHLSLQNPPLLRHELIARLAAQGLTTSLALLFD